MKNSKEMADSVFMIRDAYLVKKHERDMAIRKAAFTASPICVLALVIAGAVFFGNKKVDLPPVSYPSEVITDTDTDTAPVSDTDTLYDSYIDSDDTDPKTDSSASSHNDSESRSSSGSSPNSSKKESSSKNTSSKSSSNSQGTSSRSNQDSENEDNSDNGRDSDTNSKDTTTSRNTSSKNSSNSTSSKDTTTSRNTSSRDKDTTTDTTGTTDTEQSGVESGSHDYNTSSYYSSYPPYDSDTVSESDASPESDASTSTEASTDASTSTDSYPWWGTSDSDASPPSETDNIGDGDPEDPQPEYYYWSNEDFYELFPEIYYNGNKYVCDKSVYNYFQTEYFFGAVSLSELCPYLEYYIDGDPQNWTMKDISENEAVVLYFYDRYYWDECIVYRRAYD